MSMIARNSIQKSQPKTVGGNYEKKELGNAQKLCRL